MPPEESQELGDFSNLEVKLENSSLIVTPKASVVCSVLAAETPNAPEDDDGTVSFDRACELGITTFRAKHGQCLMVCKDITFETLRNATELGVSVNIRLFGELELIDNSTDLMPDLALKEKLTLGRDLGAILVFAVKSHLPASASSSLSMVGSVSAPASPTSQPSHHNDCWCKYW